MEPIVEETRIFPRPTPRGPPNALLHESILTLRFLQHSTVVTALFIAVYFAYWHVTLVDPIPAGLYVVIGSASLVLILSHAGTLAHNLYPESATIIPLKNTLIQASSLIICLIGLETVPYIGAGKSDDWFKPIRESQGYANLKPAGVEEHHAVLGRCIVWLSSSGLFITLVMAGVAIWRASKAGSLKLKLPRRSRSRGDYMAVGGVAYEFDEEDTICEEESVKSM